MSVIKVETSTARPNFLDSDVGLVCKTRQLAASLGVTEGAYKTVKQGTIYPANTSSATGIVFQDADVTDGDAIGSVMVAGRVIEDRITIAAAAKTALKALGFVFVAADETKRGYYVTYVADDGTGTPPEDITGYLTGDTVNVSTSYPLTKSNYTQTGWSKTSGGAAITSFEIDADTTLYPVWTAAD